MHLGIPTPNTKLRNGLSQTSEQFLVSEASSGQLVDALPRFSN
jgi:hypothetical protein